MDSMRRGILARAVLLAALVRFGHAQEAPPAFSSDVRVVSLLATVRNSSTRAVVKDLTKDDFRLEDDGRRQTIRYFSRESDLPLVLALLVDTSQSMSPVFEPERAASNRFFERVLREDRDVAALVHFDFEVGVLQEFTSSREKLAAALGDLKIPPEGFKGTRLYDGIRVASEKLMKNQNGRKAFILLSDGLAFRDPTSIDTAIEYAQRADTLIYSILYSDPGAGGPNPNLGPKVMERLARETGGSYFAVSRTSSIDDVYAQIDDELRNQYSIGYTPEGVNKGGKYHRLKLTVARKGLVVRTRDGYYPK
jgi:VWFA-related protein